MIYIRDEEFIRGNCPMTKEEIRILSISKMKLDKGYNVLDIGAGTGSISIQAAKICNKGHVTAIERDDEAIDIINKNKKKFSVNNLSILKGEAVELLNSINETYDAIFIGGSGGNLDKIIESCYSKLKNGGNIVLDFITISNVYKSMETLKRLGLNAQCTQISISKTRNKTYMLMANNPIFIVSAEKA